MRIPLSKLKRSVANLATHSLFLGADTLGWMSLGDPADSETRVLRDVAYADRPGARLDVHRPAGEGPFPVVFHVHGGGFTLLSKETHWMVAEAFARRGFIVVNVDYRLAPEHTFPAAPEDVADAYCWMVRNIEGLGGDLERVVLAGESAGANLIVGLAVAATFERDEFFARKVFRTGIVPKAVLPASGLLQISNPERLRDGGPVGLMARNEVARIEREYLRGSSTDTALADPLLILESSTPATRAFPATFASWGGSDPIGPDSRRLVDALSRRGVVARGEEYGRETHSFHVFMWRDAARIAWRDTFEFLDRHLSTEGRLAA